MSTYTLQFSKKANRDLAQIMKSASTATKQRVADIIDELETHPTWGIGHPEKLKGDKAGYYSRQLDKKNRIIYSIHEEVVEVHVISMLGHYDDK